MQVRFASEKEKNNWNEFVYSNQGGSFLQSWEWSEFLLQVKPKVWRVIIENNNSEWLAVCVIYEQNMQLGQSIIYAPRGPIFKDKTDQEKVFNIFLKNINNLAEQEKALSFEMDLPTGRNKWTKMLVENNFQKTRKNMLPRHTLILDIRADEQELLAQMHQKTRYNIRLAGKKGVTVVHDNDRFKDFLDLFEKTKKRQDFSYYSSGYFKKLLQCPLVKLYLAEMNGKVIAANIMIFSGDTAIYLFGASDYEYRKFMAPHLLQWEAIKKAQKQGLWFYDFWGVAPEGEKGRLSRWAGFTRFKKGFSPKAKITEYLGTYEKVFSPVKLGLYRFLRKTFKK